MKRGPSSLFSPEESFNVFQSAEARKKVETICTHCNMRTVLVLWTFSVRWNGAQRQISSRLLPRWNL